MNNITTISGLELLHKNYDIFILDQWGVMHDGQKGYKNAIDCVKKLKELNKKLIIISNSSKRNESTILRLPKLGFDSSNFVEVMTSGEMIWQSLINENYKQTKNLGKKCFNIYDETNEDGKKYLRGLEKFDFVDNVKDADFILACTPFANKKVVDFIPLLNTAKNKNLLFICANPDFDTIEKNSNKNAFCMGTIAELYKNMGGQTLILGKPSVEIYKHVLSGFLNIDKSRILAIGDSLHHDIKGAINFGIDSLLVTSTGIHQDYFDKNKPIWESNKNSLKKLDIQPTYLCSDLSF